MSKELKPCPFCGGDNVGVWEERAIHTKTFRYSAHCYSCHFGLAYSKTEEQAIKEWNTRKLIDDIVEQLEALPHLSKLIDRDEAIKIVKEGAE